MIDHEYTDAMVCPCCGAKQSDIWELKCAYNEDALRVECQKCEKPFDSWCHTSHIFTTKAVDVEAERLNELVEKHREAAEVAKRYAACQAFPPGTPVRVREDSRYADFLRGREGVVANRELSRHNPFVHVDLDARGTANPYTFACFPDELEVVT